MVDNKEEKIKSAATELFARFGLRKTTIDDIAKAASVGKGTVYLYFKNKDELFLSIIRREGGELMRKVRKAVAKEETAEDQLRAYFRTLYREIEKYLVMYAVSTSTLGEIWPVAERVLSDLGRDRRAVLADILAFGVERGELGVKDIELASHALDAIQAAVREPWIHNGRELEVTKKADTLLEFLFYGMTK
jgi:AcrR family transcriptional regulator